MKPRAVVLLSAGHAVIDVSDPPDPLRENALLLLLALSVR